MMRVLVIGLGSIGHRHVDVLRRSFAEVELMVLSSRMAEGGEGCSVPAGTTLVESIEAALRYDLDFAIVASPAPFHLRHAEPIVRAGIPVLIEKPLCNDPCVAEELVRDWPLGVPLGLAYVLRFSSTVAGLQQALSSGELGRVLHVSVRVGQYLPYWRPAKDYRGTVSASKAMGGGVLLELSHELDLALWLLGTPQFVSAQIANTRSLEIDTEDTADVQMQMESGALLNVHLDMLSHQSVREWHVVGEKGTAHVDLLKQVVTFHSCCGSDRQQAFPQSTEQLFQQQLQAFYAWINGAGWPGATLGDGLAVLKLVSVIRRASQLRQWVQFDAS